MPAPKANRGPGRLTPTYIYDTLGPLLGIPELTDKLVAPRET